MARRKPISSQALGAFGSSALPALGWGPEEGGPYRPAPPETGFPLDDVEAESEVPDGAGTGFLRIALLLARGPDEILRELASAAAVKSAADGSLGFGFWRWASRMLLIIARSIACSSVSPFGWYTVVSTGGADGTLGLALSAEVPASVNTGYRSGVALSK
ncbi:hypothetical protein [Streptomyces sp. NPDC047061]|uniref:hypothetical protein n=1 Tax=Streptomyces sp. NPDC047061 TaxID=3154605 RepID=UPI0033D13180